MTIRDLRLFQAVCEEGSVTGAAKRLYMTQPAVSHAIRGLEEEIGALLFDRLSGRMVLNQTGRRFLEKAVRLLELYEELEQGERIERSARFRLGSSITIANFWLPSLLKRWEAACPGLSLRVTVDRANETLRLLRENELDAALVEGVIPGEDLTVLPFSSYFLRVVCASGHPCRENLTVEELEQERLLLREKGSAIRDAFDSALFLRGVAAEPDWTSVNSQALIEGAKNGFGLTVLPDILVEEELERGSLREIQVEGFPLKNENHLVFHKDKPRSAPLKALLDLIRPPQTDA